MKKTTKRCNMCGIEFYNKKEVMRMATLGEMSLLLITAMEWEDEYQEYKKRVTLGEKS